MTDGKTEKETDEKSYFGSVRYPLCAAYGDEASSGHCIQSGAIGKKLYDCLCKTLNEEEGIGYKRLVTFSIAFMKLIKEFYEDPEVEITHIKQRLAQHGIDVSGEFYSAKLSGATSKEQAVYDHAMQSVQAAQLVGAVAMNDVFGFGQMRQERLRTAVQKQTERYAKEGEGFLLEAMEKIGFKVEGDQVRAFMDQEGNPVSVSRAKKEGWTGGKYGT